MDDLDKERVRFNIGSIKLLTLLLITIGGGLFALLVEGPDSILEVVVVTAGVVVAIVSGTLAILIYRNTLRKLKE